MGLGASLPGFKSQLCHVLTTYVMAGKLLNCAGPRATHLWKGNYLSHGDKARQVQRLASTKLPAGGCVLSPLSLGHEDTAVVFRGEPVQTQQP